MQYKIGDILQGKVNGKKIQIVDHKKGFRNRYYYIYKDLQADKRFIMYSKTLENCMLEKVNK